MPACTTAATRTAGSGVLELDGDELPPYDAELGLDGKVVGRVTSAVARRRRRARARLRAPRGAGRTPILGSGARPRGGYTAAPRP